MKWPWIKSSTGNAIRVHYTNAYAKNSEFYRRGDCPEGGEAALIGRICLQLVEFALTCIAADDFASAERWLQCRRRLGRHAIQQDLSTTEGLDTTYVQLSTNVDDVLAGSKPSANYSYKDLRDYIREEDNKQVSTALTFFW